MRNFLAVITGFIAMIIWVMASGIFAFFALGSLYTPPEDSSQVPLAGSIVSLAFGFVGAIIGGFVAALIGRSRRPVKVLAGFVLVLGLAMGFAELLFFFTEQPHTDLSIRTIWYRLHANSLVGFQALIEKGLGDTIGPMLWGGITTLFTLPGWLVLLPPAFLCMLARKEERRGTFG